MFAHGPQIRAVNFARRRRARYLRRDLIAQRLLKQMIWVWRGVLETVLERNKIDSTSARAQDKI